MAEFRPLVSVNGKLGASISPLDRGLAYGDGLFETIRLVKGHLTLWDDHWARLQLGCQRLGIPLDAERLEGYLQQLIDAAVQLGLKQGIVKILLTRGASGRGYAPPPDLEPTYCLSLHALPQYPETYYQKGVRVRLCQHRLSIQPALAGLKHLNRLDQVMARSEWQDEAIIEGLMRDDRGELIEGTFSNLFIVRAGELLTPPVDRAGIDGVMRRYLLRLAPQMKIPAREARLDLANLKTADEVFLCNSVFGIWPVAVVDEVGHWPVGPVTQKLRDDIQTYLVEGTVRG